MEKDAYKTQRHRAAKAGHSATKWKFVSTMMSITLMLSKDVLKEPTKRFGSGLALKIVKKTRRLEPIKPESVSTVVMTTTATQLIVLTAVCMELYYRWLH